MEINWFLQVYGDWSTRKLILGWILLLHPLCPDVRTCLQRRWGALPHSTLKVSTIHLPSHSISPIPPTPCLPLPILTSLVDLPQQEFATSEPMSPCPSPSPSPSPPTARRNLTSSSAAPIPQALPHISHLLRHVDDYWNSRAVHKSPPRPSKVHQHGL